MVRTIVALGMIAVLVAGRSVAQQEQELLDLRGLWKFEIGDDPKWASPKFDDSRWAKVLVPAYWEDEGFPGYDGYAWYRTRFQVPESWKGKTLYLKLATIDDVDEVYINGKFVAFNGSFPPKFYTTYNVARSYYLPPWAVVYGAENTVAIRVYDQQLGGGIVHGRVGVYEVKDLPATDQTLKGPWRFCTGDDMRWADPRFDDSGWRVVEVPAYWETQGFKGYDGFAWYRTTFTIDPSLADQHLVLFLGKVDDMDETYLDGERIGRTGSFPSNGKPHGRGDEYRRWRAYTIPPDIARKGGVHTLAVRVYDVMLGGGMYMGPLGIVERNKYKGWQRMLENDEKSDKKWLEKFLKSFGW